MDAFDSSDSSAEDDDAPSPEKAPPDFRTRKSDEDSVATGDDSAGWEMEEDRVMNSFLAQTEAEEALDDLSVNIPMTDVHEFMLISEEEGRSRVQDKTSCASDSKRENAEGHRYYVKVVTAWQKAIVGMVQAWVAKKLVNVTFYEFFYVRFDKYLR
jgi:hypothetical protein